MDHRDRRKKVAMIIGIIGIAEKKLQKKSRWIIGIAVTKLLKKSRWIIGIAEKKLQKKSSERIIGIIGIANSKKCSQKTVLCKKIQP